QAFNQLRAGVALVISAPRRYSSAWCAHHASCTASAVRGLPLRRRAARAGLAVAAVVGGLGFVLAGRPSARVARVVPTVERSGRGGGSDQAHRGARRALA